MKNNKVDVVVIGSGIAGSCLGLALQRNGLSVHIIDQGGHPRFALGESTLPPTSMAMTAIAHRWNVPELHDIAVSSRVNRKVAASSGVKKNFGFIYHTEQGVERAWHEPIPGRGQEEGESHLYRQDIDAYLYHSALQAGVVGHEGTNISDVSYVDDGVRLETTKGERFDARFVIDASGYRSVLSEAFDLRESPTRFMTRSRALFTHMIGVAPFDNFYDGPPPRSKWHEGTLHHFFDGGWMWVIPFDNHPESRNRLCSVGLMLDVDKHPLPTNLTEEEEWHQWLERFPSMGAQFADAVAVRPWIRTGRVQYSNKTSIGSRYWLTAHASGNVDALFSRGLLNNFLTSNLAIRTILDAFRENDFSTERFEALNTLWRNVMHAQDVIAFGFYAASSHPDAVAAAIRMFTIVEFMTIDKLLPAVTEYAVTGDMTHLDLTPDENWATDQVAVNQLLERYAAIMLDFSRGGLDSGGLEQSLLKLYEEAGLAELGIFVSQVDDSKYRALERLDLGSYADVE